MAISSDVFGDVGEDDVGHAVGVQVAGGHVAQAGLGALRLVAGDRLESLALAAGLEHAEAVGAGDQEVVAAIAVEVGDVHALEVDRADRQAAARAVDAVLLRRGTGATSGPVEQDDVLRAVAVDIECRGALDLAEFAAGVVLVLDLPAGPRSSSRMRRANVFWATIRAGPFRSIRLRPAGVAAASGPRPPLNGAGRLACVAQEQDRRAVTS